MGKPITNEWITGVWKAQSPKAMIKLYTQHLQATPRWRVFTRRKLKMIIRMWQTPLKEPPKTQPKSKL